MNPGGFLYGYSPLTGEPLHNVTALEEIRTDPRRIIGRTTLIWKTRRSIQVSTVLLPWPLEPEDIQWETHTTGDVAHLPPPMNEVRFDDLDARYDTEEAARTGHRAWCRLFAGWLTHAGRHTVTWQEKTTW